MNMRLSPRRTIHALTRPIYTDSLQRPAQRSFHVTAFATLPRKRSFFTSNPFLGQDGESPYNSPSEASLSKSSEALSLGKRKPTRAAPKHSLRQVAIKAQQPKRTLDGKLHDALEEDTSNVVSATCLGEGFDMPLVLDILSSHGFAIDPDGTSFDSSEVVHARGVNGGDIFVFPSGTIVTWSLPADVVTRQILRAVEEPHAPEFREVEDLEFVSDKSRESSTLKGDVVVLGTRKEHSDGDTLDTTLAKIAFSSGLARSTKLAVLESALTSYFNSTRAIPDLLRSGSGVPMGRRFILQKTGELLSLRARLNHYSELTDSLPDIFWDSRHELNLEGYYETVGRALDVNVRIRTLNQKMDYAQEIATVLREMSSEQHGTRLEVIIIALIAVEVIFEMRRIWLEWEKEKELALQVDQPQSALRQNQ